MERIRARAALSNNSARVADDAKKRRIQKRKTPTIKKRPTKKQIPK